LYLGDPFDYQPAKKKNLFDSLADSSFKDNGDHSEIFGFQLLKFDEFAKRLDPLNGKGTFKGFSPRWMFPTKLRNVNDAEISTSSILIVLDSAREVELDLVPYFGKQILGDSEIMISETAARHLQVTNDHKEKIEVFFDVISLFNLFSQQSGQSPPEADEDDDKESTKIKEPTTENDDKEGIKAEVEDTNGPQQDGNSKKNNKETEE
jgi:hypothetical protein